MSNEALDDGSGAFSIRIDGHLELSEETSTHPLHQETVVDIEVGEKEADLSGGESSQHWRGSTEAKMSFDLSDHIAQICLAYQLANLPSSSQISFHGIDYSIIKVKKDMKQILRGLSGVFGSQDKGEMIAIMGQSGAGKTTLLNTLAQRIGGHLKGEVRVNGKLASKNVLKKNVGYVHQHDHLYAELTVFETVDMLARLTLRMSPEDRVERVKHLIFALGLDKVIYNRVGTTTGGPGEAARGLSGGERKRLSIAKALIPDPGILLLDEYTSGLDSESALSTTELLRLVANSGRTVIATIHQPSTDIFLQFDKLCLLSEGRMVYYGPVSKVLEYFNSLGPEYACPAFFNPAEHVMKMVFVSSKNTGSQVTTTLVDHFQRSNEYQHQLEMIKYVEENAEISQRRSSVVDARVRILEHSSIGNQFLVLFLRAWTINSRNRLISRAKLVVSIFMGIFLGVFYLDIGTSQLSVNDRLFLMTSLVLIQGVRLITESITYFGDEKDVVLPELESGFYDVGPYFITKGVVDIPWMCLSTVLFAVLLLPIAGLQYKDEKFVIVVCALLILQLAAQSIGVFFATLLKNLKILTTIIPLILMPMMLLSGVSVVNIPRGLAWLQYINPTRYALLILFRNEFEGLVFSCDNCKLPYFSGDYVLHQYKMYFVTPAQAFGILISMAALFRFGAYLFLRQAVQLKRS